LVLAADPVEDDPFDPAPVEAELFPVADDLPLEDPFDPDFPEVLPVDPRDALDVLDDPVEPAAAALDCVAPDEEALEIDEVDDPELVDEARVDVDPEDDPTLAPVEPEETVDTVAVEDELPGVPVEAVALEEELLAVLEVWDPEEPAVVALAEAAVLDPDVEPLQPDALTPVMPAIDKATINPRACAMRTPPGTLNFAYGRYRSERC
jgi:hypothetical protein